MKLTQEELYEMAREKTASYPLSDEERKNDPPGRSFVETAKDVGGKAFQGGAMAVGAVGMLGKPLPLKKMDPRY